MPLTTTIIANSALDKVGSTNIDHYETDDTTNAVKCQLYYQRIRDALLRSFTWNFATTRIALVTGWVTATAYTTEQYVWKDSILYKCAEDHTSDDFDTDLASAYWTLITARPASGFAYAYDLPNDCIRVIGPLDEDTDEILDYPWRIESGQLLYDETELFLKYIYKNENPEEFDSLFVQVLIYSLAAELAPALKQNENLAAGLIQYLTGFLLPQAKSMDAKESSTRILQGQTLLKSRLVSNL